MNMVKYLVATTIALIVLNNSIGYTAPSNISAQIYQVDFKPVPHLVKNTINGIKGVYKVITAGKYAWALGDNATVAFFDGSKWQNGVSIQDMNHLRALCPSFPLDGTNGKIGRAHV